MSFAEKIKERLVKENIVTFPTAAQVARLWISHEKRSQQGKSLGRAMDLNKRAELLWAKDHKAQLDQLKQQHNAKQVQGKKSIKYVVPTFEKGSYSVAFREAVNEASDMSKYHSMAERQHEAAQAVNNINNRLQQQPMPRYLTGDMKTYVRRMLAAGATEDQAWNYIQSLGARVPAGNLVGGKPPKGARLGSLPVPTVVDVKPIVRAKKTK